MNKAKHPARHLTLISFEGLSKWELNAWAVTIAERALDAGNAELLAEALAAMEYLGKKIRENPAFQEAILDQLRACGGKLTLPSGTTIEATEAGVTYDYGQNPQWVELKRQEEEATARRKAMEDFLKTIPAGKEQVDEETGEVFYGPAKGSKSTYKIILKK